MNSKRNQLQFTVKYKYRLIALFLILLCALSSVGYGQENKKPSSKLWMEKLAQIAADTDMTLNVDASVTRDDLGVTAKIAPIFYEPIVKSLLDMNLQPFKASGKRLDVPKPFTVRLKFGGWEEKFSFTSEKITVGGAEYFPANPAALRKIYERDDHYGLLTKNIYYLRKDWDFSASDVKEVRLLEMSYSDQTTLTLTGKKEIESVVNALGGYVVRPLAGGEMENPKTGGAGSCTITLFDGTVWVYYDSLPSLHKNGEKKMSYVEIWADHSGVFGLVGDFKGVPGLSARIGDNEPKIYVSSFDYAGNKKTGSSTVPVDMGFDADHVIPPGQNAVCTLRFADSSAREIIPSGVKGTIFRENNLQAGEPLEIKNNSITLPTTGDKYYVSIEAKFPDGTVNYTFEYRVTTMPGYFDDIGFGNNENDVTVVRDDVGVSINKTGQNRKFVDFIKSLEIRPAANSTSPLPVKKPFTMKFANGGKTDVFKFTQNGIAYNGAAYETPFPKRIEALYEKVTAANFDPLATDSENSVTYAEDIIDYMLRGFLSKDVARFADAFSVKAADIQKLVVVNEMPDSFVRFDATSSIKGKSAWLESIVLAKNWSESDNYIPRRFFYSFEITMKNGTAYTVGEKLLINGKDSGWYIVQSDSEETAALKKGIKGKEVRREKRLPGGISVDDNGVITFF